MTVRHKVFISFHHGNDERYRQEFIRLYRDQFEGFVDRSVQFGDIDENLPTDRIAQLIRDKYIRDATVAVVLVGTETWKRKHVDWEIYSSLRDSTVNARMGLLGILLPTYTVPYSESVTARYQMRSTEPSRSQYWPYNVPQRLFENIEVGFATMRPWPSSGWELQGWIHEAFLRRNKTPNPNLAQRRFGQNRSSTQTRWQA